MQYDLQKIKETINPSFYPLLNCHDRYLSLRGGGGSGKSYFIAQKILLRVLFADKKGVRHKILCLRKTLPDVRRSVYALLRYYIYEWKMEGDVRFNKTDMTLHFKNGCEILCTGLDQPEKIKSIHGITSIWLEEASEFTNADFMQVDLRLRGIFNDYYQIMMSFNPISKQNWIYKEFYGDPIKIAQYSSRGFTEHHSTYRDNIFLDQDYIDLLKSYEQISNYHYQVYTLGQWGVLSGLIYEGWDKIDEMPTTGVPLFGCDFGYNAPTAITEIKIKKRKLFSDIFLKERLYQIKMTNSMLIRWIKKNLKPSNIIVCDSAEPNRIKEMQNEGIKAVGARKGANSVFDGIDWIKTQHLHIVKPSVNLLNEISGYQWKMDKKDEPMDEPIEINDHLMDSMRYPLFTKYGYAEQNLQILWV